MGDSKRHHIVPEGYLVAWAAGKRHILSKDIGKQLTNKNRRAAVRISVKDAAVSKNRNRDTSLIEHGLSATHHEDNVLGVVDSEAIPVIRRLCESETYSLSQEESLQLMTFLAHQPTRGDLYLEHVIASLAISYGSEFIDGLASEDQRHLAFVEIPHQVDVNYRHLVSRNPLLVQSERSLITCDEPVVPVFENMNRSNRYDLGDAPFLLFPLGPSRALLLFHQDMPVLVPDGYVLSADETSIMNTLIAGNCTRFIYGDEGSGAVERAAAIPSELEIFDAITSPMPAEMKEDLFGYERNLMVAAANGRWSNGGPTRPLTAFWPDRVPELRCAVPTRTAPAFPRHSMLETVVEPPPHSDIEGATP